MSTTAVHRSPEEALQPLSIPLIDNDRYGRVMHSIHHLGKPNVKQLYRLHQHEFTNERDMHRAMNYLSTGENKMLTCIKPIDLNNPSRWLPHIFIDTTKSRRYLEQHYTIPYRRVPVTPSRDMRFLYHDAGLVDELISFELTARSQGHEYGYESMFDSEGKHIFPRIQIAHNDLTHSIRPQPDKVLSYNGYKIIVEHDCGEETVRISNIIRDATIGRKYLVYDALLNSPTFDVLNWKKKIFVYLIEGNKRNYKSSQKRIKKCLSEIPAHVNEKKIYFANRLSFLEAGDDISQFSFIRGDGREAPLPCFK